MPPASFGSDPLPAVLDPIPLGVSGETWGIVFAGGIGARFWPLSSPTRPKPALQLLGERSLISGAVQLLAPAIPAERVLVVTARDIAGPVAAAVPEVPAGNVLVEPRPLGTAAALAWALQVIEDRGGRGGIACAVHADISAGFPDQFRRGLELAIATAAQHHGIVTLGSVPTRPEPAFGHVLPGDPLDPAVPVSRGGVCRTQRFVEKPPLDVLAEMLSGGALWHTGVVVGRVTDLRDEVERCATELHPALEALQSGNLPAFAANVRAVSVERGVLERSSNRFLVPVDCAWDDVGTWSCLRRARELDDSGNGAVGPAHFVDSVSNVVHSESGTVVLFGCNRMLVVTLPGLTFVTPLEKAADLKALLDQLPAHLRDYSARPPQ